MPPKRRQEKVTANHSQARRSVQYSKTATVKRQRPPPRALDLNDPWDAEIIRRRETKKKEKEKESNQVVKTRQLLQIQILRSSQYRDALNYHRNIWVPEVMQTIIGSMLIRVLLDLVYDYVCDPIPLNLVSWYRQCKQETQKLTLFSSLKYMIVQPDNECMICETRFNVVEGFIGSPFDAYVIEMTPNRYHCCDECFNQFIRPTQKTFTDDNFRIQCVVNSPGIDDIAGCHNAHVRWSEKRCIEELQNVFDKTKTTMIRVDYTNPCHSFCSAMMYHKSPTRLGNGKLLSDYHMTIKQIYGSVPFVYGVYLQTAE
jgi:hypothetical protein